MLLNACGSGIAREPHAAAALVEATGGDCKTPQRIRNIRREDVYDLSGYQGVSGGSPFDLFDEADHSDPLDAAADKPVTNPHPVRNTENYFRDKGSRIVTDLRVPYKLSDIYLFDRAHSTDTVWVYTGTPQHWKLQATLITKGDPGRWGWRKLSVNDESRFVMFRFNSTEADITEAAMYGCPQAPVPGAPAPSMAYKGPRLPAKTMREFLGVNCYNETPMKWVKPFYMTRMYVYVSSNVDDDTVHAYPNMKFNIAPTGWWNNGTNDYYLFADSVNLIGNKIWYAYMGVPKYLEQKGYDANNRPVTRPGMDTENPLSYGRHASMFWNMAAAYGATRADTHQLQVWNPHRFSGRNIMNLYENGNEIDAWWVGDKYCNPMEYFALSSADYDGHEGKLGPRHGIKQADRNSELMMSGIAGLDTNRVRVLKFLCNTLRSDGQFLWKGGIQYHHYSVNGKAKYVCDQFFNSTGGITPEEDSLRQQLSVVREATYRIQPDVECILGEWGYDKSRSSKVSAPLVPGYSQSQSQGIMLLRGINATAFSGFDRLILYWLKDVDGENSNTLYLTSGMVKQEGDNQYKPYPAWFYISTLVNRLADYVPDRIVSEKGNVWIYKYRNKTSPGAVAYFVYCPTHKGVKVANYPLQAGKATGAAELVRFEEHSVTGSGEKKPISNGAVTVNVSEMPTLVLMNEH